MIAQLSSGHVDLADVLFLVALILFLIGFLLSVQTSSARPGWLTAGAMQLLGLAAFALAWFVL